MATQREQPVLKAKKLRVAIWLLSLAAASPALGQAHLQLCPPVNERIDEPGPTPVSGLTRSGPIFATRSPPGGRQPASAMVNSQIFPSDSTTVPRDPLAVSASARVA